MKIFKRVLSSILVAVIVLTAAPLSGFVGLELDLDWFNFDWLDFNIESKAAEYTDGIFTYTVSGNNATITGMEYSGATSITIPSTIAGSYAVTAIGYQAFYNCTNLESVALPDSLQRIGYEAFSGCTNLSSVDLGNGLTTLEYMVFKGCKNLTSIEIPASLYTTSQYTSLLYLYVDEIKYGSYSMPGPFGGSYIRSVTIESGMEMIPKYLFSAAAYLETVVIPVSVNNISDYAFYNCDSLKSITIGGNIKEIGNSAFSNCDELNKVVFYEGVETLGQRSFSGCSKLVDVDFADSIVTIGYGAFEGCVSLVNVVLGSHLTTIEAVAFYNCSGLKSITFGNKLASIERQAFYNCTNLESVALPDSLQRIGYEAFSGCTNLSSVDLGNGLTTLEYMVFKGCKNLTSIEIPASLYTTSQYTSLLYLYVDEIKYGSYSMPGPFGGSYIRSVTIESGMEMIPKYLFSAAAYLETIGIPASVSKIDSYAFYNAAPTDIYFGGSEDFWNSIEISSGNEWIADSKVHFNCNVSKGTGVNITMGPITLNAGETHDLMAVYHIFGSLQPGDEIQWTSSDSNVVFIEKIQKHALFSRVTIKSVSDGVATITATTSTGHKAYCNVIVGNGMPSLLITGGSELHLNYDWDHFDTDRLSLDFKIENTPNLRLSNSSESLKNKLIAKGGSISIELPEGLSFSQTTSVRHKTVYPTNNTGIYPGTSYEVNEDVYLYNLNPSEVEKEIIIKVAASNAMSVTKTVKVKVSDYTTEKILNDLSESSLSNSNRPKKLLKDCIHTGDMKVNDSTGRISSIGNVTVNGHVSISGGELYISKSFKCNSIEISGGTLVVNGDLTCGGIRITGGCIKMYNSNSTLTAADVNATEGSIHILDGVLFTNNINISTDGKWGGQHGGHIYQTGGRIVVKNNFTIKAKNTSDLTGGELWIGGNFEHGKANDTFKAVSPHSTIFYGGIEHTIDFDSGAKGKCSFGNLYIDNSYKSNRGEKLRYFVKGSFRNTTADINTFKFEKNGVGLDPKSQWQKNVVCLSDKVAAVELRGSLTLANIYTDKQLEKLGKTVAWWSMLLSSPIIKKNFKDITDVDQLLTIKNFEKKGYDLNFVVKAQSYGEWASFGAVYWYCDKLGVSKDNAYSVGLTVGWDIQNFTDQAKEYLIDEFKDELLDSYKGMFKDYALSELKKANPDKVLYLMTSLVTWSEGLDLGINYSELNTDSISLSVIDEGDVFDTYASDSVIETIMPEVQMFQTSSTEEVSEVVDDSDPVVLGDKLASAIRSSLGLTDDIAITENFAASITHLNLRGYGLNDLTGIEAFSNLTVLDLSDNYIYDLSDIALLTSLESLDLSNNSVKDISKLESLTNLQNLDLSYNLLSDFSGLFDLTSLVYLDVSSNLITSIDGINDLVDLKHLNISNNTIESGDLSALEGMNSLEELYVNNCNLNNVSGITSEKLIVLNVSNNYITDISMLSLKNLKYGFFDDNSISDISVLKEAKEIITLSMSNNALTGELTSEEYSFENLEIIDLSGNSLTSVEFLLNSNKLYAVNLSENEIQTIDYLNNKTSLSVLELSACGLTEDSVKVLRTLTSLETLDISNNSIADISFALDLHSLNIFDVSGNGTIEQDIIDALSESGVTVLTSDNTVYVSEVQMLTDTVKIGTGGKDSLRYFIYPIASTNRDVIWESSDPSVVVVDEKGMISAFKPGTATITVTTVDGGKTATATITVYQSVESIALSHTTLQMVIAETKSLNVEVIPSTAEYSGIVWSSSDETIATVDDFGNVTSYKAGTVTITATAVDNGISASCVVVVGNPAQSLYLSYNTLDLIPGQEKKLIATVVPIETSNQSVKWISTNPDVALVDENGNVKAIEQGETTIYVETADGLLSASCVVTVTNSVFGFSLNSNSEYISVNGSLQLYGIFNPETAENKAINWTTSDSTIATVEDGFVSGHKAGSVVIVATTVDGGYKDYCIVRVVGITPSAGVSTVIDAENGYVYGLTAGMDSLNNFVTLSDSSCSFEYDTADNGFGTGTIANIVNDNIVVDSYTIIIFGDVNGDGWYDGQDAILVSCLANGMLTKDDVSEAVYMAADCNHDGVVNQLDVDLLNQAGTLLANVDQSKPADVLLETSSEYVEYISLIDQSPEIGVEDNSETEVEPNVPESEDKEVEETPTDDTEDSTQQDARVYIFEMILNFIKSIFEMLLSYISVPIK